MKVQKLLNITDLPVFIIAKKSSRKTLKKIYDGQTPELKSKSKLERWLIIFKELKNIRNIKKEAEKVTRAPIHIA